MNSRVKVTFLFSVAMPLLLVTFQNCNRIQTSDVLDTSQGSLALSEQDNSANSDGSNNTNNSNGAENTESIEITEKHPNTPDLNIPLEVFEPGQVVPLSCSENLRAAQGDMAIRLAPDGDYFNLSFGTLADNYWDNGQYDKSLSFYIDDISQFGTFVFNRAAFDDWLWVKVNGQSVYFGPYEDKGIERIRLEDGDTVTNVGSFDGELSTSWDKTLNIDIKPYLQNGENIIWTRTIVQGNGENFINMRFNRSCPEE